MHPISEDPALCCVNCVLHPAPPLGRGNLSAFLNSSTVSRFEFCYFEFPHTPLFSNFIINGYKLT